MPKTILDSYDEFNFMVVILFIVFTLLIFFVIILINMRNRSGINKYSKITYNNYITSDNISNNTSNNTPQTTPYQYNYAAQLNQYNLPTQGFY